MKILVAGVGNVLRGDDGFGVAVAARLSEHYQASSTVTVFEAGIAGISLVQELMNGYDWLIMIDAVERGAAPGTIFLVEPAASEFAETEPVALHQELVDAHYAEPSRVLRLAAALDVLPAKVYLLGCQVSGREQLGLELSPAVAAAVPVATERLVALIDQALAETSG